MTNVSAKISHVLQKRLALAQEQFNARIKVAYEKYPPQPVMPCGRLGQQLLGGAGGQWT